jgi:hypothetical protein
VRQYGLTDDVANGEDVLVHANSATGSDNSANAGQIEPPVVPFPRCDSRT